MDFVWDLVIWIFCVPVIQGGFKLQWHHKFSLPDVSDLTTYTADISDNHFIRPLDDEQTVFGVQLVNNVTGALIDHTAYSNISAHFIGEYQNLIAGTPNLKNETFIGRDGKLCVHDVWYKESYERWRRNLPHFKMCMPHILITPHAWLFDWFKLYRGELFIRNWMLTGAAVTDKVFLRIQIPYGDEIFTIDTPKYTVLNKDHHINRILLNQVNMTSVVANHPFSISLKVVNSDGNIISTGIHSKAEVMGNVAYVHKIFEKEGSPYLAFTENVLAGDDVITSVRNDKVIFKNFDHGVVNITMKLEDVSDLVFLNFTVKKPFFNYRRYPEDEFNPHYAMDVSYGNFDGMSQTVNLNKTNSSHIVYKFFDENPDYFRGVLITNLSVTAQIPKVLRLITGSMNSNQYANYPIESPLQVELLDVDNYRITSGPDSNLTVTVHSDVSGTCISKDATFNLDRGAGTFTGSFCRPISSTSIYFKVQSSVGELKTNPTSVVKVLSKYDVVVVHDSDFSIGEDMVSAALYLSEEIYYLGLRLIFAGRNTTTPGGFYSEIISSKFGGADKIMSVIGLEHQSDFNRYVDYAEGFDIPMISAGNRESLYAYKNKYPLFQSVAYPEKFDHLILANILKSRKWTKIVVITSYESPPPLDFISSIIKFGIKFDVVNFPAVNDKNLALSSKDIEEFFILLDASLTRIIIPFLKGETLQYMVSEISKKNKHTSENGYQWLATQDFAKYFPFNNEGRCSNLMVKCTDAFHGTMIIKPHYPKYGQTTAGWAQMKEKFGKSKNQYPFPLSDANEDILDRAALYYDATLVMVHGYRYFLSNDLTVTPKKLAEAMYSRDNYPSLLTSKDKEIKFDGQGRRMNYSAYLMQFDVGEKDVGKDQILKKKRFLYLGENITVENIPIENKVKEINVENELLFYAKVNPEELVSIDVLTTEGSMNEVNLKMSAGLMHEKIEVEKVPPPYFCSGGCGGNLLHPNNVFNWEHGTCIKQGVCRCKIDPKTENSGYLGSNCQKPICNGCLYGNCTEPSKCMCLPGYINSANKSDCAIPTCLKFGCNLMNGQCTSADFCKCKHNFYGKDCSKKCACSNGKCSDGESGSGNCVCDSGYTGEKCDVSKVSIIVPSLIGAIVLLLLIGTLARYKYKQVQLMAALMSTDWKADWDSIRMRQQKQKSSMKSLMSMISAISGKSGKQDEKTVSQNQAQWNGRDVVVKHINKDDVELTDEIRWEIKQMRDLQHPNLCLFIGAVCESPNVSILNEVCGKGSLEDILSNDDIDLGWDFRYSMMKDICRGMQYLSGSEIQSHGRLKSSNCLVDNRWCVKLADYGMITFKGNQHGVRIFSPENGIGVNIPKIDELDQCDYYNLLWSAPEIVATGVSHPNHVGYGTTEGDIYSFGIILVEMCTRHHPYHELDFLQPHEIVQMVGRLCDYDKRIELVECRDSENIPIKVLRPQVQRDELPNEENQAEGLFNLIQMCWSQDLKCRPSFKECMNMLNRISPHRGELMDNLILLMEQYTNNLESIVAERTLELREEKEKSDLLLSKMLPPLIAEELKSGNNPVPEYFNCVTIYFSDVVGFGKLCADSSPYEVVDLLNDLYSVMDDVIDSFDCYKVETIGDCYVVASGLPVRNGDQHAGEIASMALQLLSSFNGIGYKHVPNSQVQLRIGMHSGPIVAGVVGLKMPRYCLFGDTMNTASRMESGGFALKIHLSDETYKILQKLGGYQFICRGERQVKGRGIMTTYWLVGKDDTDLNLPSEDLALSASQHDFK